MPDDEQNAFWDQQKYSGKHQAAVPDVSLCETVSMPAVGKDTVMPVGTALTGVKTTEPAFLDAVEVETAPTFQMPAVGVEAVPTSRMPAVGVEAVPTSRMPAVGVEAVPTSRMPAVAVENARTILTGVGSTSAAPQTTVNAAPVSLRVTGAFHALKQLDMVDILLLLLPLSACILWLVSLRHIPFNAINDLGLISALPPGIIAAIELLVASFVLTLQRKKLRERFLFFQLLCLIVALYSTPALVEEMPRFAVVYTHAGYTEYIMRTGGVNPYLALYFNWPGFFVTSAFLTRVFGYSTILSFEGWAPICYNLLYLGPMYLIFTSITPNKRHVWLSLLFFQLLNWVGQDYYSPQGLNFFLYLVIISILVKWFLSPMKPQMPLEKGASLARRVSAWLKAPGPQSPVLSPWKRRGLLGCLIGIFLFIVATHPLTPFFTILSVGSLVIFRRCGPFWLPILMIVLTTCWIVIVAQPFMAQHLSQVIGTLGDLTGNVPKSVTTGKVAASPLYQVIAKMRLYTTLALWGAAALGIIKRLRQGHHDLTYILLAASGFPLIAAQSYGGEMLMRIYLFAEPFMVFFTAALLCENPLLPSAAPIQRETRFQVQKRLRVSKNWSWHVLLVLVVSLTLLGNFFFTRYGDERVDYVTYAEWNAMQYLYQIAPAKSFLLESWNDAPLWYENYEKYDIQSLTYLLPDAVLNDNVNAVVQLLIGTNSTHIYLIFTQEQQAHATAWNGLPPDALERLEAGLLRTGLFHVVYSSSDAQILQYIGMHAG